MMPPVNPERKHRKSGILEELEERRCYKDSKLCLVKFKISLKIQVKMPRELYVRVYRSEYIVALTSFRC